MRDVHGASVICAQFPVLYQLICQAQSELQKGLYGLTYTKYYKEDEITIIVDHLPHFHFQNKSKNDNNNAQNIIV